MKLRNGLRRILSLVITLAMMTALLAVGVSAAEAGSDHILEAKNLTAFGSGAKKDGDTDKVGDFTILWSSKSKVDGSDKTFDDGYASAQRINFGAKASVSANSIRFETAGEATVKIWWVSGGDNRQMGILNASGEEKYLTAEKSVKNSMYISELKITEAGTWFLGGIGGSNYIFKVELIPAPVTISLEAKNLTAFGSGAKKDGDTDKVGDFTILWSSKSKVDGSDKTFDDGYASAQRINFGAKASVSANSIRFETAGEATVKIWWVSGGDNRQMGILNESGEEKYLTAEKSVKNSMYISELKITEGGTWFLGGIGGSNYIFRVDVTTGAVAKPERAAWSEVEAPVITGAVVDGETIQVSVSANVGYDGADKVAVSMFEGEGLVETGNSSREAMEHVIEFKPGATGEYTFKAEIIREGEEPKAAAEQKTVSFTLPLGKPAIISAANAGSGSVTVEWESVKEATGYVLAVGGTEISIVTRETAATVSGLTVGETYSISVLALRNEERSEADVKRVTVTEEKEIAWAFSAFGTGVSLSTNGYELNSSDGSVRVYSNGGKGKLVPNSTDGLAFYYTKIDPKTENFKLTATANVNSWQYSNGQEGFGIMAADAVGKNGDSATFWNNSYMAVVTKVEYQAETGKISMKLGVGSQEKKGVESENINASMQLDDMSVFSSTMRTLDKSCAASGAGTYNIVGNYANATAPTGTIEKPLTSFKLSVEKNNTGYFVSYTAPDGATTTEKYYDTEALSHLDEDYVYVGFFASRYADITFSDIELKITDPKDDAPAEEQPTTEVDPNFIVESAAVANGEDYTLVYYGNADGVLSVKLGENEIYNGEAKAGAKVRVPAKLTEGRNEFTVTMTPDKDYKPSEHEVLSSYEPVTIVHTVNYAVNSMKTVYVSPDGNGTGTRSDPARLTAVINKAFPGNEIILLEGTYRLRERLVIDRGIDGTEASPVTLKADPEAKSRPVIDFGGESAGIVLAGNYWHLYGFDVTNTKNGEKGIQVSGAHNVLELLETYRNGNTGIQISRFKGTDAFDEWPHDNLILNCSSYLNADLGYEDADGFAAKLTIGNGNVFDGCVSYYNADDGWDLYAKVESGPIGKVVIKNSVAYKNGYILDADGKEVNAGNGNGFKMGGESLSGYHTLINSVAFANKSKGIDSNSCPDIQVENSISYDNESYNVAFYTNTAVNTDYSAKGLISFKQSNNTGENIKPKGTQDEAKIYGDTNFYFDGAKSANKSGTEVSADWFVSLDTQKAVSGGITRNPDGTVNMNGYLELTDKAPDGVGAAFPQHENDEPDNPIIIVPFTPVETEPEPEPIAFTDVSVDHWAKDAIDYTSARGIFVGTAEKIFSPEKKLTRAEFITALHRAAGEPAGTGTFADVAEGAWYYNAAAWAKDKGIALGTGNDMFSPNREITREELAVFLCRFALSEERDVSAVAELGEEVSPWANDAVKWAVASGLIKGTEKGLAPYSNATRAQAAEILMRYLKTK